MFVKGLKITMFIFSMKTSCLLIWAIRGLIAVKNESGLLLAPARPNDSLPISVNYARWCITLLVWHSDKRKRKRVFLWEMLPWNFPSLILISKSKNLASFLSFFLCLVLISQGRYYKSYICLKIIKNYYKNFPPSLIKFKLSINLKIFLVSNIRILSQVILWFCCLCQYFLFPKGFLFFNVY